MAREIKTKLTLEGEKQYKSAMREAASALKVLDSEQKVAKAQFEATGDAQEYAAERVRILKEQIEEQKKAVEAAEAALTGMKNRGVDPASRAFQTWQTNVNNAKAKLIGMQTSLSQAESDINGVSDAMADGQDEAINYGSALQSINSQVSFDSVIKGIDSVTSKIEGLGKFIASTVGSIWSMMHGASQWADDLKTEATISGLSTTELQQWRFAADQIDVDVDTIISARTRLFKATNEATHGTDAQIEQYQRLFNELNVGVYDNAGNQRNANDIFWDTVDALGAMGEGARRDEIAYDLFGKKYNELLPLFEAGSEGWAEQAERAPVASDSVVDSLGDLNDAFDELDATWTTAKYELLSEFAGVFTDIANSLTDTVNAFREWSQTEEGRQVLESLAQSVQDIVTAFGEDADFAGAVNTVKDAVNGLVDAFRWISNHSAVIVNALEAIGIAWGVLTVTKAGVSIAQGVAGLKSLLTGGAAAAGGGAAAAGGGSAAAAAGGGALAAKMGGIWSGLGSAAIVAAPIALAGGAIYGMKKWTDWEQSRPEVEEIFGSYSDWDSSGSIVGTMTEGVQQAVRDYWAVYEETGSEAAIEARENLEHAIEEAGYERGDWGVQLIEDTFDEAIRGVDSDGLVAQMEETIPGIFEEGMKAGLDKTRSFAHVDDLINELVYKIMEVASLRLGMSPSFSGITADSLHLGMSPSFSGVPVSGGFMGVSPQVQPKTMAEIMQQFSGVDTSNFLPITTDTPVFDTDQAEEEAQTYAEKWAETLGGDIQELCGTVGFGQTTADQIAAEEPIMIGQAETTGQNTALGFADGLYAEAGEVAAAAAYLGYITQSSLAGYLDIHSPSKVMAELGGFTAQGFAQGIEDSVWRVERATARMVDATTQAPSYGASSASGSAPGGDVRAYIVMDKEIVGELVAPVVDGYIGASILESR